VFVAPVTGGDGTRTWTWHPLPEPDLGTLAPRSQHWELSRYRAYQARLAGRLVTRSFARCTEFLLMAAELASVSQ
jgi:hypothetical protein